MSVIREYAKEIGHEVVGKLTRHPEKEYLPDDFDGKAKHSGYKFYVDEVGNEYHVRRTGVCIVAADGSII